MFPRIDNKCHLVIQPEQLSGDSDHLRICYPSIYISTIDHALVGVVCKVLCRIHYIFYKNNKKLGCYKGDSKYRVWYEPIKRV